MRYIFKGVIDDLKKKMVFIGGPRQSGKTTLAQAVLTHLNCKDGLLNWDNDEDRQKILKKIWSDRDKVVGFDEIHKYRNWKTWIKGVFDKREDNQTFLVTGSARLDVYRRGGDSLLGRYHYWRLHPFTLDELPMGIERKLAFERLMTLGGFPEPFLSGDLTFSKRWRRDRFQRILKDDVRELESIKSIQSLESLTDLLRDRVGGSIAFSNLARDIRVSPQTVENWINILEKMYLLFVVRPYSVKISRSILKAPKVYFFDNGDVFDRPDGSLGPRFENLVASHLLKRIHFWEDSLGDNCELRYLRDKDGREVDFVIIRNRKVEELIEVKYSDTDVSSSFLYFINKLKPKRATLIVATLKKPFESGPVLVTNPVQYFSGI